MTIHVIALRPTPTSSMPEGSGTDTADAVNVDVESEESSPNAAVARPPSTVAGGRYPACP